MSSQPLPPPDHIGPNWVEVLDSALAQGRVGLAWQPVLRSCHRPFIAFHEGLLRLRLPSGAPVLAAAFIDDVENTPVGRALDRRALAVALQLLAVDPRLRLSINIAPATMTDTHWNDMLARAGLFNPAVPERLIVEVTERAAMQDPDRTLAFLARNRAFGCSFAIDDFGAGQTAFAYFRKFRFDMVKIDGQFIHGLDTNPDNAVLVDALVRIARHFEMLTIAEFIENRAEARAATALGVDCLQGFYCGHAGDAPIVLATGALSATG